MSCRIEKSLIFQYCLSRLNFFNPGAGPSGRERIDSGTEKVPQRTLALFVRFFGFGSMLLKLYCALPCQVELPRLCSICINLRCDGQQNRCSPQDTLRELLMDYINEFWPCPELIMDYSYSTRWICRRTQFSKPLITTTVFNSGRRMNDYSAALGPF